MNTINISLTEKQASFVNTLIHKYGFANRSEFFRAVLRVIAYNPDLIVRSDNMIFESPKTKKSSEILKAFSGTNKYSKEFLKDLETGLAESPHFH
ncbi:MAG: hypothetical protein ABIB98_02570 [bacterium]